LRFSAGIGQRFVGMTKAAYGDTRQRIKVLTPLIVKEFCATSTLHQDRQTAVCSH
jgi:hypothetical protein